MDSSYARACTEILEILKYMPENEVRKIPKEKIEMYKENRDLNYKYTFNPNIPLENQEISSETNAMFVILFRDYFSNDLQKEKLNKILDNNDRIIEEKRKEKYNYDNIFKKRKNDVIEEINEDVEEKNIVIYKKENIFVRFFKKIFKR